MEAKATIDPRSTPHRRRRTTTVVAPRTRTAGITTRRHAITRLHRVTTLRHVITSLHRATIRRDQGPVIGLTRTRAGAIVGATVGVGAVSMDAAVMAVTGVVTVDRSHDKAAHEAPLFCGPISQ